VGFAHHLFVGLLPVFVGQSLPYKRFNFSSPSFKTPISSKNQLFARVEAENPTEKAANPTHTTHGMGTHQPKPA
jgi:hypothetical protein